MENSNAWNDLSKQQDTANFKASNGWIDRWKAQNNVKFKTLSGEGKSCIPEMTVLCKETHPSTIISRYKLEDIFNADEFSLFFQALPNKTLELKGKNAVVVNTAKSDSPGCAQRVLQVENYLYLPLERAKIRNGSRTSSPCYVSTKQNQKAGLTQRSSQIG